MNHQYVAATQKAKIDTTTDVLKYLAWILVSKKKKNWTGWIRFYMTRFKGDIHLVFYETMKSDLRAELIRMREFLKAPVDCKRLWCTVTSNQQTKFKRTVSRCQPI